MSHLTCAKAVVTDIDALEEAFKKLPIPEGWNYNNNKVKVTFMRDQKTFRWYGGETDKCDHAIRIEWSESGSAYEIGVVARPDGGWNLQWDSGLHEYMGYNGEKIMALYAEEVCAKYAADTGSTMERQELEDGNLRIELLQV